MACFGCCAGGRVSSLDETDPATGLTGREKEAVQRSWAVMKVDWKSKHGKAFFIRLFTTYPNIRAYFPMFDGMSDADLRDATSLCSHIINFAHGVTAMVDTLQEPEVLVDLIHKLTANHFRRGVSTKEFEQALDEFVLYAKDSLKISEFTEKSWRKTASVVCAVVKDHMNKLKSK